MPAQNKTSLGLNQWLGNEYPKRIDFVEDNQIINDELEKRVKYTDIATENKAGIITENRIKDIIPTATDTIAGILTLNKVREVAPQPDLSPYVPFTKGYRSTNNTDSFIRTNGTITWASLVLEMWNGNTYQGKFHTNGGRAYYAVPGRNNGNFNEIMDNHDMAVRDNKIGALENFIGQVNNRFHSNNPNNRGIEDIFAWHVREIRLAGFIELVRHNYGSVERNGYVVTGIKTQASNQDFWVQMRVLQFYRNGQWLNAYFA